VTLHYVRIDTPHTVWHADLRWLLERCDSVLPGRVCVCSSFDEAVNLKSDLKGIGRESTILDEKPMTQPLPEYARIIVASWLDGQREESRCHKGYG
jgi:hypothetical protein